MRQTRLAGRGCAKEIALGKLGLQQEPFDKPNSFSASSRALQSCAAPALCGLPAASNGHHVGGLLHAFALVLNDKWAVEFDPLQWVLTQRRGDRWHPRSFCVTREGLLDCIRELVGDCDLDAVHRLPEWHPDRQVSP